MKSGEFNDLLPPECTVDKETVFVRLRTNGPSVNVNNANDINNKIAVKPQDYDTLVSKTDNLPAGNYSVILTPDWQGSGRIMLTVRMTVPEGSSATGFNVFYKMKTTFSNINRRGTNLTNSVSFTDTTYKQSKPNLKINTLDSLDLDTKPYYTSIDNEYTAYAKAQTDCIVPSIYTYGLTSLVQAEGSKLTEHEIVGLNTNYTYNVNYCNNYITDDLVFFNPLEHRMDDTKSDWHGDFLGIDVSQIKKIASVNSADGYCNPEVYYTTKDRTLLSRDDFDLDSEIWSKTPPSDLSLVTAVAVDCRKTTENKDFVLPKKQTLGFGINMRSPGRDVENNDITYNEAAVYGVITENNLRVNAYAYTDVTLKFSLPELVKTAFPGSGTADSPAGVVKNSVLRYSLAVTNRDDTVPMLNVVVEDYFDSLLNFNNVITGKMGDDEEIPIDSAARVSSYSIDPVSVGDEVKVKFSAVIDSVAAGETITINIPVTVAAPIGSELINKARITSMNGVTFDTPVESKETYHEVTGTKAKILKIKSNGDALPGAVLQIFENNNTNFDSSTGKNKAGAEAIELRQNGQPAGEGEKHDCFTSTNEVTAFDIAPGNYVLHEKTLPANYQTPAADIPFRVDIEGIHYVKKNNRETAVSYIEMVNVAPYQVIYHTNPSVGDDEIFRTFDSPDLVDNRVPAFGEIPEFTGDAYYSFLGWYTQPSGGDKVTFDRTYESTTHLYAHWHAFKVIFHVNNPNSSTDDEFRTFYPSRGELNSRKGITHFYDIPAFAGDKYVFAGWYHNADYLGTTKDIDIAADFEKDTYEKKDPRISDPDYHLYAKWIEVGTVSKDSDDGNNISGDYSGFGLAGVQIRKPSMTDSNYNNEEKPGGLRFVTSLKEELLKEIDDVSPKQVTTDAGEKVNVEYGYVVGTEKNINAFRDYYGFGDDYRLQYKGEIVNGKDTTGKVMSADTDYRYIRNVNCTSNVKILNTYSNGKGMVAEDHRNYDAYRLYTLVVTYKSDTDPNLDNKINARSYIRYYDANGKLRVFYNDYRNADDVTYYGGCMCSFNQVDKF